MLGVLGTPILSLHLFLPLRTSSHIFQEAHFEEVVVKAIDAHWFDEESWTVAESQEPR